MKTDLEIIRDTTSAIDSELFIGRFVRRQGLYGTIAAVGRLRGNSVEVIPDSKRSFPRDGLVETHGIGHHAGLRPGDWIEFDVARNQRKGAPRYKVVRLTRLPRYAVLPEATMPAYRALLIAEGWRGHGKPGLWAFRLDAEIVVVVEMEAGKDGRLRISRNAAREVKCYRYDDQNVVQLKGSDASDDLFLPRDYDQMVPFDWSDEADHVARVIRSLAGANDPRLLEIITWLDLHHEQETGKVVAFSGDSDSAKDALRSGALARQLRADRELMEMYLAAALQDDAVRDAVAAYAKEGRGPERDRLRKELAEDLAKEKNKRLQELSAEINAQRAAKLARLEQDLAQNEEARRNFHLARLEDSERDVSVRIQALEIGLSDRRDELEVDIAEHATALKNTKAEIVVANEELENLRGEVDYAGARLAELNKEIDRLLAISQRLTPADPMAYSQGSRARAPGIARVFPNYPKAAAAVKGQLISSQVMLTNDGKELLQSLLIMFLSAEMPILVGDDVADLLRIAETIICPGRYVSIEADPTLISLEDLWSRPGSGMPTLLALAADAAKDGGAVLVVIRGIERSGARFWAPALMEALRSGGLPRGLFVCCTVHDREHDEVNALPDDVPWLEIGDVFTPGAISAGPSLLTHPQIDLETLDPGPMQLDLSSANSIVVKLGKQLSLGVAMRAARMLAEANKLLDDDEMALRLVLKVAKPLALKSSQ